MLINIIVIAFDKFRNTHVALKPLILLGWEEEHVKYNAYLKCCLKMSIEPAHIDIDIRWLIAAPYCRKKTGW